MDSREKYEIPDWVVDDYNGRVSEEERICFVTGGLPVWDVGWSYEILCKAKELGLGQELKLWDSPYLN